MFSFHMLSTRVKHQIVDINIHALSIVPRGVRFLHKNLSPFVGCPPSYDHFKTFTLSPSLCFSKFYKCNCEKAPYGFLLHPGKPLHQAIHLFPGQTNSPRLHGHTNQHLLNCTFSKCLTNNYANLKAPYNQGIKMQVVIKDVLKQDRICMKFSTPEA